MSLLTVLKWTAVHLHQSEGVEDLLVRERRHSAGVSDVPGRGQNDCLRTRISIDLLHDGLFTVDVVS